MYSQFVKSKIKENAVILEAGADNGLDTIRLSNLWPDGTIHTFEPNPSHHPTLIKISEARKNVMFYPTALGKTTGNIDFYQFPPDFSGANSTLEPNLQDLFWKGIGFPHQKISHQIKVDVWNLDEWANNYQVKKIDFMRLDLQGSEGMVLQSCPNILKSVSFIQIEYQRTQAYSGAVPFQELTQFMFRSGFKLLHVADPNASESDALFGACSV
jgi:FkbM family methyltransferase